MSTNPLLLLDNSSTMSVLNHGTYKCTDVSFEEVQAIMEMHQNEEILQCFSNRDIEDIIYKHLGMEKRNFTYKHIRDMRLGQDALVFKQYITPSETQPIIETDKGNQAKKVQNIYVYCQLISRIE